MENTRDFSAWIDAQFKRIWPHSDCIWAASRTTSRELLLNASDLHHCADHGPSTSAATPAKATAKLQSFIDDQYRDPALDYWSCSGCERILPALRDFTATIEGYMAHECPPHQSTP